MKGHKVIAMSAIGNPASFEQTLNDIGAVITESLRFPDHHDYTEEENKRCNASSRRARCRSYHYH